MTYGNDDAIRIKVIAIKEIIKLWQPNGHGAQSLCDLKMKHRNGTNYCVAPWIINCIGFCSMSFAASNNNDNSNKELLGIFGMHFKINLIIAYIRGATVIPLYQS